jgi:hypothetical protein
MGLGGVAVLVVVAVVGLYLGLQTRPGGRLLRRIALFEINQSIAGHVDLGSIEFHGTALTVRDVVLFDPDPTHAPVVKLARLGLAYRLRGALAHRVDIDAVELERPEIDLVAGADGLNLSRALAGRGPAPPAARSEEKPGKGWQINLVRLSLMDGSVRYATDPAAPGERAQALHLDALSMAAAGRVETASHDGEFHLAVGGRASGPAPFSDESLGINVHLVASAGHAAGKADVSLGHFLALDATLEPAGKNELHIGRVTVPPAVARIFAASWPVVVPLLLTGKLTWTEGVVAAELALRGEGVPGTVTARGDGNFTGAYTPHGIRLEARRLSLSQFLASFSTPGPTPGPLDLTVDVAPGSLSPEALSLTVNMDVPHTLLSRQPIGPMHLDAKIDRGILAGLNLAVPVPGAVVTADGGQRDGRTVVGLRVVVSRLSALRAAVLALAPAATLPPLDGAGSVEVSASGPHRILVRGATDAWTARARVAIPRLKVGPSDYRGIMVDARIPELTSDRQSLDLAASLKAPLASALSLSASIREGRAVSSTGGTVRRVDLELTRMTLGYPGTRWVTHKPAGISIEDVIDEAGPGAASGRRIAVRDFAVFAGAQRLSVDARRDDHSITADARVTDLRVQDLPPLRTAKLRVAGLLGVSVHAEGDPARPRVDARVSFKQGIVDRYGGVAADIALALLENRTVRGKARVRTAQLGDLDAELSGPGSTPLPPGAPISATIDITGVRGKNLPIPPSAGLVAGGDLQAHLNVRGTVRDPRISLHVTGRKISLLKPDASGSSVTAATGATGSGGLASRGRDRETRPQTAKFETLALDLDYASPRFESKLALVDDERGSLRAAATAKLPLAELRAPGGPALGKRPITGSLNLVDLDPQAAGVFLPSLKELRGQITAAFDIRGSFAAPQVGGQMSWRNGNVVVVPAQKPDSRDTAQARAAGKPHASRGEAPSGAAALLTETP